MRDVCAPLPLVEVYGVGVADAKAAAHESAHPRRHARRRRGHPCRDRRHGKAPRHRPQDREHARKICREGLSPGRAFEGLVAEVEGQFAGMCLYLPVFSTWVGETRRLHTRPRRRRALPRHEDRRGADPARRTDRPRARGASHLRLAVDLDNTRAQAFYERLGVAHYADDRIHAAYGEAFDRLSEGDER